MAIFDPELQRMCVRVVYDGAASAGKTTNLRQLAELFATQRSCELFSPAEMNGRTLYFDWLQIAAGMVCGFPLVCQIITVPGQQVLTARRRHLLATADVVVHVCDSEQQAVQRAIEGLALFDDVCRERAVRVPLVVQANKQDQLGAASGTALLAAIGRPGIPVVEAIASDAVGVVDTFVAAVRAAVRSIQSRVESGDVRVPVRRAETAAAALEKLSAEQVDPEWAIEMLLEEASNAFALADVAANDGGLLSPPVDEAPAVRTPVTVSPRTPPAFPTEHVPTGFVWPAHTGRAALRAFAGAPELEKPVVIGDAGAVQVEVGEFVLSTGRDRRFDTAEGARQALVRAARERTQLGALLAPETVLVVQPAGSDASWLWTILPKLPAVSALAASREMPSLARRALLAAFGSALVEALKVEAAHGMTLDLLPASYGVRLGVVRYLGNVAVGDPSGRDVGRELGAAFEALAAVSEDVEPAVVALESGIATKLTSDEVAKLARRASWGDRASASAQLREVCARIRDAFGRVWKAA